MSSLRSLKRLVPGLLLALAACRSMQVVSLPALHPLDEWHAAEFRQVFDAAGDQARCIVALSPT